MTEPTPASQEPTAAQIPSLPDLLISKGAITDAQMQAALAKQRETGAFLGEILIEEGLLDEKSLISFLAKHCRIPHLSLLDYLIDASLLELVPKDVCKKYRLLPIDRLGRNLTVAMVNPLDAEALTVVRQLCPDLRIKPILCAYQHFATVTERIFNEKKDEGPVSLSASSFGLKVPGAPSAPKAEVTKAPVAPVAEQETRVESAVTTTPQTPAPPNTEEPDPFFAAPSVPAATPEEAQAQAEVFEGVFQRPEDEKQPTAKDLADSGLSQSGILMREMATCMMDSMRDTYAILARRMDLFREVAPEDVAKIFARGITREFAVGAVIFEKGQPGDVLYLLLNGQVRISDGNREIAALKRGDMFGEMALISEEARSATATALTDVSLLALNQEIIRNLMPRDVSVQLLVNIVVTLSTRLREANAG